MDAQDLFWLAGYLEGEGSFYAGSKHRPNVAIITVESTDRDVIEHVAQLFHCSIQTSRRGHEHYKPMYKARLYGQRARELMHALHPLMGKRRQEQIDRALACFSQQRADQRGAYNHKTRLSELQVLDIYRRACAGENRAAIAREYGVHHMTVQDI